MEYERTITLIIDSKIDSIALLSTAVRAICNTVVTDNVVLYNIELCLVEAVSNVINHAYHHKSDNFVEIVVTVDDYHVSLSIKDNGEKANLPPPKQELDYNPNDVSSFPESGMGLFIINRIMDEVSYEEHEGKNVLTMKKKL